MSLEIAPRRIPTEWRTIIVSQTCFPIMYEIKGPQGSEQIPRWFTPGYATVRMPIGTRIITRWQEQVRKIRIEKDRSISTGPWYTVREWTEAEM